MGRDHVSTLTREEDAVTSLFWTARVVTVTSTHALGLTWRGVLLPTSAPEGDPAFSSPHTDPAFSSPHRDPSFSSPHWDPAFSSPLHRPWCSSSPHTAPGTRMAACTSMRSDSVGRGLYLKAVCPSGSMKDCSPCGICQLQLEEHPMVDRYLTAARWLSNARSLTRCQWLRWSLWCLFHKLSALRAGINQIKNGTCVAQIHEYYVVSSIHLT